MLLETYRKEIFRPECNPRFQSLHCIAYLQAEIGEVLPYLNAALGGDSYTETPPSVTFKVHGKLITIHSDRIAINALRDGTEADKILEWLKREINETWESRESITPRYETAKKPGVLDVLRCLPKTNCRACGLPTCMVFAVHVRDGIRGAGDCCELDAQSRERLLNALG